jgi:hypothetical protein
MKNSLTPRLWAINQTMQGSGENPAFSREEIRTAGYENDDESR